MSCEKLGCGKALSSLWLQLRDPPVAMAAGDHQPAGVYVNKGARSHRIGILRCIAQFCRMNLDEFRLGGMRCETKGSRPGGEGPASKLEHRGRLGPVDPSVLAGYLSCMGHPIPRLRDGRQPSGQIIWKLFHQQPSGHFRQPVVQMF